MNSELIRLRRELRETQSLLEIAPSESLALKINEECGFIRRQIRAEQQRLRNINVNTRPRFTERGRS